MASRKSTRTASEVIEDLLSRRSVRLLFRVLARQRADGTTMFERICEHYHKPGMHGLERARYALPNAIIRRALDRKGVDGPRLERDLLHHRPTVRALALTARSIARFGLTAPQRYVAPMLVVWNITGTCNLTCKHCYQDSAPRSAHGEMTRDEKLRVVDELGANGVPMLAIAGGEPLACRDLWPVLEAARRNRVHVTLATNGTLITPAVASRLAEAGVRYVEVSVDSASPAEHDGFRAQAGAWERATQGIRNVVGAGMDAGLATCLTHRTVGQLDDLVALAGALGCETFSFFNFIPVGRAHAIESLDLSPSEREAVLDRLNQHLQSSPLRVISTAPQLGRVCVEQGTDHSRYAQGHAGRGAGRDAKAMARYVGGCGAGRCYCAIQPDGTVTPCVYIRSVPIGNLRTQRLAEVWDNPLFERLSDRTRLTGHCRVCDYRSYCGGCRARALAYTGDIMGADPGCIENEALWRKLAETEAPAVIHMAQV